MATTWTLDELRAEFERYAREVWNHQRTSLDGGAADQGGFQLDAGTTKPLQDVLGGAVCAANGEDSFTLVVLHDRAAVGVGELDSVHDDGGQHVVEIEARADGLPDFSERLASMGFKPVATEWRLAWDVMIRQDQPSAVEDFVIDAIKSLSEE